MNFFSILDRYLIKKFLSVLFFSLIAMITIFVAVNYVENADKFIDRKVPGDTIFTYYINFVPNIITLTLPVDILMASLFSIGSLARFNELTAIKSSGISLYRVIFPVIVIAALVSVADFWLSETIVPGANITKSEIWKTYVDRTSSTRRTTGTNIYMYDPNGTKVFIERFDKKNLTAANITIQTFYGQRLVNRIDAAEAVWDSSKSLWVLHNGWTRSFENNVEHVENFARLQKNDLFFVPEDILKRERNPDEMNFRELSGFIQKLRSSGARTERWEVDYQRKFSYPLTCFFMVLFGAPLAASRRKSGAGMNIFFTLIICLAYWSAFEISRFFGYDYTLTPLQSAWLANVIFGLLSVGIFLKLKS
jgi:lipopolysaccharide export system permease protein